MMLSGKETKRVSRGYTKAALTALILCWTLFSSGCGREEQDNPETNRGIARIFESGPLTVVVSADKREMTAAEKLAFSIQAGHPEDIEPTFPDPGDNLGDFKVIKFNDSAPKLADNRTIETRRDYTLEPFLPGTYEIPALDIIFTSNQDNSEETITTEPLTITVKSLLPEDMESIEIRDISGPLGLPRGFGRVIVIVSILALTALLGVCFWLLARRRSAARFEETKKISPHALAEMELRKLNEDRLVEKGMIKEFYYRISGILRRYIENRFGLKAPEQTTEEFLETLAWSDALRRQHKLLLKEFLNGCDMVKFAEHRPDRDDIQKTFDSCNEFITATREPEQAEEVKQNAV